MLKKPFLIFMLVVSVMVFGIIAFIQSARFAKIVQRVASRYIPEDSGIQSDFQGLQVKFFPPGFALTQPTVTLAEKNIAQLPGGTRLKADSIEFTFLPFQMLSGNIRVHRVSVIGGDMQLEITEEFLARNRKKKSSPLTLSWDELLQIHVESVVLEETKIRFAMESEGIESEFVAENLELGQWNGKGGIGYDLALSLREIRAKLPKSFALPIPRKLDRLQVAARINAAGLQVSELALLNPGIELKAAGAVRGNLLKPSGLPSDLQLDIKGDLERFFELAQLKNSPRGTIRFQGRLKGDLERSLETMKADGMLRGEGLEYMGWRFDSLEAEAGWSSNTSGGEISVQQLALAAQERKRRGGFQSGSGGRLQAGPFKFQLANTGKIVVPLQLNRAHIHWVAAPVLKEVYPLDFRVSGPITAELTPPVGKRPWDVQAQLKLKVDEFQLDNQRLKQDKALLRVLKIPQIGVEGKVSLDARELKFLELALTLPRTRFDVTGEIDFQDGLDFRAKGVGNLEDVGIIAENKIRGTGTVDAHIHGPPKRVILDFDTDLKDAYYLDLALGHLKGRVTYDEDPSNLYLRNIEILRGRSSYRVDGIVNAGDAETVSIDAKIQKGALQDLIPIFDDMTRDLSWFPRSLTGSAHGHVQIFGGIDKSKLTVAANIQGQNWEYLGERFKAVIARGGYDKGKFHLEAFHALKQQGTLSGRIAYHADEKFDWDIQTENFSIADIDHLVRLDVPMRGKLKLASTGKGKLGAIESMTQASVREGLVRGVAMPASELSVKTAGGVAQIQGIALGGQGSIDVKYDFKQGQPSYVRAELNRFDFSPVLLLLNPKVIQDRELKGLISGMINLDFRSGSIERGSGKLALTDYVLAKTGTRFQLAQPVNVNVDKGTFNIDRLAIKGTQGEAILSLQGRSSELDGTITGSLDLSIAEFMTQTVSQAGGLARLDFSIGGMIKEPTIFGRATLDQASLRVPALESPFENIAGAIQLRQNVISLQGIQADLANGRVGAGGQISLFADRFPLLDLTATLRGNKVKIYPFQFVKVDGDLKIHGEEIPYLVEGQVRVDSAVSREKMLNAAQGRVLRSANYTPPPTSRQDSDYPKFKLNINVNADRNIIVQNELFDAELRAQVVVVNTIDTPRLIGTVDLISGNLTFKDRVFQIQSANMRFDNPAVINPQFSLGAATEVTGTKIQLFANGRLDNYKIELSSNPALPEQEILSLLALGMSSDDIKRLRSGDRAVLEQGQAASLLLHSTDFNRDVEDKTGLRIELDEASNSQLGTSIFTKRKDIETNSAPKIVIRRQITNKVDLSVGSTVGVGTSTQREVNAEWKVAPGFSVIGVWDSLESGESAGNKRDSYGVDLKVQKRFK